MRLIDIAKTSAKGILRHWDEWDQEATKREHAAQCAEVYAALMVEFLSAEIEEQMTVAFNRGYEAAQKIAEGYEDKGGGDALFASVEVRHSQDFEMAKEFCRQDDAESEPTQ